MNTYVHWLYCLFSMNICKSSMYVMCALNIVSLAVVRTLKGALFILKRYLTSSSIVTISKREIYQVNQSPMNTQKETLNKKLKSEICKHWKRVSSVDAHKCSSWISSAASKGEASLSNKMKGIVSDSKMNRVPNIAKG